MKFNYDTLFGMLAVLGSPMLLAHFLLGAPQMNSEASAGSSLAAFFGILYIAGWMAGVFGIYNKGFYGGSIGGKTAFVIQIFLLSLALIYSILETMRFESGPVLLAVTDAGYPLSHLFMTVTGIFVLRAKIWRGAARFAPLIVGLALPASFALIPMLEMKASALIFSLLTCCGIALIGAAVIRREASARSNTFEI